MSEEGGRGGMGLVLWIIVPLVAAGAGFASSLALFPKTPETTETVSPLAAPNATESAYIPFDAVTVNLNNGQLNRFLNVSVTLQVRKTEEEEIRKLIDVNRPVLRTWMLSYLSELDIDDIRGAAGQNRIRREIKNQFNSVLFTDGFDHIYDLLFEEFNVQ